VLVDVSYVYIDDRLYERTKGDNSLWYPGQFPCVVGWEVVGKVAGVGNQVARCKVGDVVVGLLDEGNAGCAAKAVLQENCLVLKPPKLDSSLALSSVKAGLLAFDTIHYKMHVEAGDTILVADASSDVGTLLAQLATSLGAFVVMLAHCKESYESLKKMYGSSTCTVLLVESIGDKVEVWEHKVMKQLLDETDGLGFDHVFHSSIPVTPQDVARIGESSDDPCYTIRRLWQQLLIKCMGAHGVLATTDRYLELDPQESLQLSLRGSSVGFVSEYPWFLSSTRRSRLIHILEELFSQLETGKLQFPSPVEVHFDTAQSVLANENSFLEKSKGGLNIRL